MDRRKIQKYISYIPFFSTAVIILITYIEMIRCKANAKLWIRFCLIFFGSGLLVSVFRMASSIVQSSAIYWVISWIILTVANLMFISVQVQCTEKAPIEKADTHRSVEPCSTKRQGLLISIFVMALFFGVLTIISHPISGEHIEDTNGDGDSNLAVIELEELLYISNRYTTAFSHCGQQGKRTNVSGELKECDYDVVTFGCKKVSGIMTLQVTQVNYDQLALQIETSLLSGNMEMIILVDGQYYDHVELNKNTRITLDNIANKTVVVRFAAESAQTEISITRTYC